MGTEVLRPHDCLRPAPALVPRRKPAPKAPRKPSPPPKNRRDGTHAPSPSRAADVYAGTAFSVSPAPSALPLPSFSRRKEADGVDCSAATRDLRRLLGLE